MNVSTAVVRFDDGAVRIELSDGAAAVPERGSLGLPAEGLRPAAPLGRNPRNRRCGFFLSENLNMRCRAFMSLQRSRRVWRRATGSSSPGETKNLESGFSGLRRLQPLEIPQNGQRIVWKGLEKTGGILEKLGEKAWRIPGRRRGLGRRSIEQRERGPRPPPDRQLSASSYPIRWRVSEFLLGAAA
jgi:hypothetical protein